MTPATACINSFLEYDPAGRVYSQSSYIGVLTWVLAFRYCLLPGYNAIQVIPLSSGCSTLKGTTGCNIYNELQYNTIQYNTRYRSTMRYSIPNSWCCWFVLYKWVYRMVRFNITFNCFFLTNDNIILEMHNALYCILLYSLMSSTCWWSNETTETYRSE